MESITFEKDSLYWGNSEVYSHVIGFEEAPYHSHDFIEFFYVKSGTCTHEINSQTENLVLGDFYLLVPSDMHKFVNSEGATILLIETSSFHSIISNRFAIRILRNYTSILSAKNIN